MDLSNNRPKLSDILKGGTTDLQNVWNTTQAATDFSPVPAGTYDARLTSGELTTSKTGTPGYKLTFKVREGEHTGRQFWHDLWLTPAAMPMAKRDLGKLGITLLTQLEKPLPQGLRCKVKVALRKDDNGTEFNRVQTFEVVGIDKLEDDFAPASAPASTPASTPTLSPEVQGDLFMPAPPLTAQQGGL